MKINIYCHLLLVVGLLGTGDAYAKQLAAKCISSPACVELFQKGRESSKQGRFGDSFQIYKEAYEICPDPALLFSAARVLHKQGRTQEAADHYRLFLSSQLDNTDSDDVENRQNAIRYLNEVDPISSSWQFTRNDRLIKNSPLEKNNLMLIKPSDAERKPTSSSYKRWLPWAILGSAFVGGLAGGIAGGVMASRQPPTPYFRPFEQ